jgi:hypothetical protein
MTSDSVVDEWQAKYLQPTSDGQITELKSMLRAEVEKELLSRISKLGEKK